jgi:hypothetical protein
VAVCDGIGNCVAPSVQCGSEPACLGYCCVSRMVGGPVTCLEPGISCDLPTTLFVAGCDERADCLPGQICCYTASHGVVALGCMASCTPAPPDPGGGAGTASQVCNPSITGECNSGSCLPTTGGPPYFLCQ